MKRQALYFMGPGKVAVQDEPLDPLEPDQVLVRTRLSAISPGSELLVLQGDAPEGLRVDETIEALSGEFRFPLKYGYAAVGEVVELGRAASADWLGRRVLAFQPHQSHFAAAPKDLLVIPQEVDFQDAVFLPNMETAFSLVMDGRPVIGEIVAVFGQGVVGLLTLALLAEFPLADLVSFDLHPARRQLSRELGARQSLDPADHPSLESLLRRWEDLAPDGRADLTFEVSGNPAALDDAIYMTGYEGRIVVGSWYGARRASVDLGGRFHRSRLRLISSQVSRLDSRWQGRWNKSRRLHAVWNMIGRVRPGQLITHRIPFGEAPDAYHLLSERPNAAIQVLLTYPD